MTSPIDPKTGTVDPRATYAYGALRVSVIIPAHNASGTISQTLESLLAQTRSDWEAIVVDDGSSDRTSQVVRTFMKRDPRIRLIEADRGGEAAARNKGLTQASYEWILFLDADDWISPLYMERLTCELSDHPDLDAVHCGSARVAADGTEVPERFRAPSGDLFPTLARRAAFPVHACIMRRSLIDKAGGFDTSLIKSPDWDLWQRIARAGARFGAVPEALAYYRMSPNAASLDAEQMLKDGLRVLKQGHSPDSRVSNPHPDHVNGAPPEEVNKQQFYLLCWCAGLLLGRGEDARPLLRYVNKDHFPELYPPAVAECIFDAAPLPTCRAPENWEQIALQILQNIDQFLIALEKQSLSPDLAHRAGFELRKMILTTSQSWQPVIVEYENRIAENSRSIDEARRESVRLHQERTAWESMAHQREKDRAEWESAAQQRERERTQWEEVARQREKERDEWQRDAEEGKVNIQQMQNVIDQKIAEVYQLNEQVSSLNEQITTQNEQIKVLNEQITTQNEQVNDLREKINLVERGRADWKQLAEQREQAIAERDAKIGGLVEEKTFLQKIFEERRVVHNQLKMKFWVRLGVKLRLLKIPRVKDLPKSK